MDNDPVENLIRPLALDRKNALFYGHDEGGASWARIASLVETCKLNGVDPYVYLRGALEAIVAGRRHSCLDQLLPWAFTSLRQRACRQQTQPRHCNKVYKPLCKLPENTIPGHLAADHNGNEPPLTPFLLQLQFVRASRG